MSCYDPISIANPRIDFRYKLDTNFILAPCGKCAGCQKAKRDDWFVRLYYEWNSVKKDGVCVFPTFTYNPAHVPHVDTSSEEFNCLKSVSSKELPQDIYDSFDKVGFQNFLKKLRKRLFRDGYTSDETGLKYFVVTEYGSSLDHLHLPHYHVLFFLDIFVEPLILKRYFELAWSHRVLKKDEDKIPQFIKDGALRYFKRDKENSGKVVYDDQDRYKNIYVPIGKGDTCLYLATVNKYGKIHYHLKNGNVSYSDQGASIHSSDVLEYVTKYLYKDSHFMESDKIKSLVNYLNFLPKIEDLSSDQRRAVMKLRGILPFSLRANEIGISLFDDLDIRTQLATQYQYVIDNVLVPNKICVAGKEKYYKIPEYVLNKLFYYTTDVIRQDVCTFQDGNEIYFHKTCKKRLLTELGKVCLQKRMRFKVADMVKHYRDVMQPRFLFMISNHVQRLLRNGTLSDKDLKILISFDTACKTLTSHFANIDPELLAVYTIKFQNLSLYGYQHEVYTYKKDDFLKMFYEISDGCIMTYGDLSDFYDAPLKDPHQLEMFVTSYGMFSDLPIFEHYSSVANSFNKLNSIISVIHAISKMKKDKLSDDIRQYFNSLKYVP